MALAAVTLGMLFGLGVIGGGFNTSIGNPNLNVDLNLNGSANASVTSFNNDEQLFIYPNPSNSDYLNVRLPSSIMNNSVQFELLNMQGQVVQKNRLTDNRINVATLSSGIYTLRFKGENFITTQKFTRIK